MVSGKQSRKARQFLLGLSTDELQYIAEFLGSCILESEQPCQWTREQLTQAIQRFDQGQNHRIPDRQHKMILLLEFLCRCNIGSTSIAARAGLG
jgi:hypothetical protein